MKYHHYHYEVKPKVRGAHSLKFKIQSYESIIIAANSSKHLIRWYIEAIQLEVDKSIFLLTGEIVSNSFEIVADNKIDELLFPSNL